MSNQTRKYALHLFSSDGQTVDSFTWGASREDAAERVQAQMGAQHVWSFEIRDELPLRDSGVPQH